MFTYLKIVLNFVYKFSVTITSSSRQRWLVNVWVVKITTDEQMSVFIDWDKQAIQRWKLNPYNGILTQRCSWKSLGAKWNCSKPQHFIHSIAKYLCHVCILYSESSMNKGQSWHSYIWYFQIWNRNLCQRNLYSELLDEFISINVLHKLHTQKKCHVNTDPFLHCIYTVYIESNRVNTVQKRVRIYTAFFLW